MLVLAICGACYAYAVVHAIAAVFSLRGGISSNTRVELAELQAALCNADETTAGCGGGWIGETYQYAMRRGILEADAWSAMVAGLAAQQCPRNAVEAELAKLLHEATRATARVKQIQGWEQAPRADFPVTQIVSNQPAVAIVHAPGDWATYDGTGVYAGACSSDQRRANHAVLIVGYTVTPERRGDLVQQSYCSAMDLVASSGGAGRTVWQIAEHYNVPINDFLRINTHIPPDPDTLLDVNTAFYVPPCTRNAPKPPLPTLDCGTTYHVSYQPATDTATSAYDEGGAEGRRLREAHAVELQQERQARMEVKEGADVVFVAGLAADGGPADTQIWYMIQASQAGTESVQQVKWASDEALQRLTYLNLEGTSIAAVTCPPGQYVTGFKGTAFVGLPWLPGCVWDALMRPGFNREDIRSRLAWAAAGSGYLTARTLICSDGETEVDLDLQLSGMRQRGPDNTRSDTRYVDWRDIDCPGGFDAVRMRSGAPYYSAYPDLFFRCRGTGEWTSYTGGVGIAGRTGGDGTGAAAPPDGAIPPVDPAFVEAVNATCRRTDLRKVWGLLPPTPQQQAALGLDEAIVSGPDFAPLRSRDHVRLFADVELEKLPGAADCPEGQESVSLLGLRCSDGSSSAAGRVLTVGDPAGIAGEGLGGYNMEHRCPDGFDAMQVRGERYGITLRELLAANPEVDPSRGLAAYDNTTLQVPQRCAGTAVQPPVSTIAAVCNRRWPLPNTTVTGMETCGNIAQTHGLGLSLPHLFFIFVALPFPISSNAIGKLRAALACSAKPCPNLPRPSRSSWR
ncbi:hypothetical protein HXX76_001378 [Chlamydomonas incerta]|uniref:LysM domain-containing protein n=1 Tax=Chlamydomonas incerta TaxID=51695 RepID=A0A835WC78_CHLIN|nr:hypothetical protein HXX76_001378 [Chlamydomonas incerta]|eukprot:KAG2444634.1 hypothetical protein HXX76_001378 [Chlamydomonas incerta]